MAPCPHIIAHMDMDMVPCLHITAHMYMDMAPCPYICYSKFIIPY